MSTENNIKVLHDIVLQYDKATISGTKPANIIKDSLEAVSINDIAPFEQRCVIMAWHIAYLEYSKNSEVNSDKTYQNFVSECVGTLPGLKLYQEAFEKAQNLLDKELTIAKLKKFQAS